MGTPFDSIPDTCTHERRPGTTVCLHCRHAALEAARERRQRMFFRGSAIFIVVAVFAGAGAVGATALRDRGARAAQSRQTRRFTEQPRAEQRVATNESGAIVTQPVSSESITPQPVTPPSVETPVVKQEGAAQSSLAAVLPMGSSTLSNGVTAVRTDSDVTVEFDQMMLRTRRPEKFESFVRQTLPTVYGPAVRPSLAKIHDGGIASQGELLTELPARGVHIPLDGGWVLEVFPETRPGQDGPLVVRYRAKIVR